MADGERRSFLKMQLGAGASFAAGLATGGAVGAAGMRTYAKGQRPFAEKAALSYAQQGEDLILSNILHDFLGLWPVAYLDVGAHHPVVNNNTFLFYERGYRGVLVEPNPDLWELLSGVRTRDVLIRGGIGIDGKDSEADYYVINTNSALNTFSKEMADSYPARSEGKISVKKVIRLPLLDINGLMQKHWGGAPHLLSVDTEGFELPILKSIDWKRYRPPVVCVDTLEFATRHLHRPTLEFMAARGYDVRGATFVNTIFVDRRYT
jgi:FkbM family methyltransferase